LFLGVSSWAGILDLVFILGAELIVSDGSVGWFFLFVEVTFQFLVGAFIRVASSVFSTEVTAVRACSDLFTTSTFANFSPSWDVSEFIAEASWALLSRVAIS
jgi:hypothetical protein